MRKRYIEETPLTNPVFNHTEVYIRSTDVNRTIMSAYSHMMGMFPDGTGPDLPKGLEDKYRVPPFKDVKYTDIGNSALPNNH